LTFPALYLCLIGLMKSYTDGIVITHSRKPFIGVLWRRGRRGGRGLLVSCLGADEAGAELPWASRSRDSRSQACFVFVDEVTAVNETWLPRCDHGQFFTSTAMSPMTPHSTVLFAVPDSHDFMFHKTLIALHYAYTQISDEFDWPKTTLM
uniref:Trafficking protein particle complex subunit 2 n=1 Tax=Heligmosomoides polygyrus TaxID=6339 RepID=A0A183GNZ4_HELPZ